MNSGQNQFFEFILSRTKEGHEEKMINTLKECFGMQNANNFNKEEYDKACLVIINCLKPEHVDEVLNIMNKFGQNHISKKDKY